jgi:uncharacterized protein with HEPN domain
LSFRNAKLCFRDIFDAIEMIEQFTAGMNFEDFRADPKTIAAVERKLQVISEAAIRIGPNAAADYPWLPWHDIRGIGNWLRHQYERIELPVIWGTVQDDLPPLKAAVQRAFEVLPAAGPETLSAVDPES